MSRVVNQVKELVDELFDQEGYDLVDLDYVKEGKNWFLRFAIDKEGGVDLNDCAYMSEKIGDLLDTVDPDPIPSAYYLEVSSPGAERPLKSKADIQKAVDKYIHVSFYQAIDGQKFVEGTLIQATDDDITIQYADKTRKKEMVLTYDQIAKARLAIKI
ncbi:ribosome maturation factor RimP [Atopobacter phocae]|uniref:ribosome maturation factor RimP n=1 Tax=Atopobacter phocae TaxID=136492 RepID=UPI00046E9D45|nr:ribosome maturation factor RimP [Atopobacter phocae]